MKTNVGKFILKRNTKRMNNLSKEKFDIVKQIQNIPKIESDPDQNHYIVDLLERFEELDKEWQENQREISLLCRIEALIEQKETK